jgi:hypothetical protein
MIRQQPNLNQINSGMQQINLGNQGYQQNKPSNYRIINQNDDEDNFGFLEKQAV